MKLTLTILFSLTVLSVSFSQQKFEKESRISDKNVPETAKQLVNQITPNCTIKWYKEENLNSQSIEAKTKYQNKKYSIEFNLDGTLQDVEVQQKATHIKTSVLKSITTYLKTNYLKHKLKKIQVQYVGTSKQIVNYFNNNLNHITINYEIVVKVKTENGKQLLEILFDSEGNMLKSDVIIFRNTDNLEF